MVGTLLNELFAEFDCDFPLAGELKASGVMRTALGVNFSAKLMGVVPTRLISLPDAVSTLDDS